jgi:hypothetical protein
MSLTEIRDLESKAFKAWPATETQANFGWVQRFAGGYTKRANSINAIEPKPDFTPAVPWPISNGPIASVASRRSGA